ncbi:hypothetical protein O7635_27880 [Asanoa sp. WMMD1127]|uniref:hypothetical protein n=1 Tax=Asanoa sp. WMMD1127 TaxID=3016107 RepID=UPI002415D001|nr:hypothetical protein [Asanoa sp. WMMD1127]MDG4825683.1 hypothetical protein [Asanoa sp. WMMD1127]
MIDRLEVDPMFRLPMWLTPWRRRAARIAAKRARVTAAALDAREEAQQIAARERLLDEVRRNGGRW